MPVQPYRHRSGPTPTNLFLIRASFLTAVLVFGAVTYYVHSGAPPTFTTDRQTITWIVLGAWGVITASLIVTGRLYKNADTRARRASLAIIGWGLGEMAALLGGVHYFLTGSPQRYGYGLIIFVISLVMFPIPQDEGPRAMR